MQSLILARAAVHLTERSETVSRLHEAASLILPSAIISDHGAPVSYAKFSPDGQWIAAPHQGKLGPVEAPETRGPVHGASQHLFLVG